MNLKKGKFLSSSDYLCGMVILVFYLIWSLCWYIYSFLIKGTFTSPYMPEANFRKELLVPFNSGHFLGTDIYGRDLLEVMSAGLVYSLVISIIVSFIAASIGTVIGYYSVRGGELLKKVLELITNLIFIFPSILIAIIVMSFSGNSVVGLICALILTGWPGYARIIRGETQRILALSYIESSQAIGTSEIRLFLKTVLPALLPQLMVHIVLGMGGVIITEATLGFLGLGGSEYSWGSLLSMSKNVLLEAPFLVIVLSLVVAGLIIGLNLLGDGLRDILDPKSAKD